MASTFAKPTGLSRGNPKEIGHAPVSTRGLQNPQWVDANAENPHCAPVAPTPSAAWHAAGAGGTQLGKRGEDETPEEGLAWAGTLQRWKSQENTSAPLRTFHRRGSEAIRKPRNAEQIDLVYVPGGKEANQPVYRINHSCKGLFYLCSWSYYS